MLAQSSSQQDVSGLNSSRGIPDIDEQIQVLLSNLKDEPDNQQIQISLANLLHLSRFSYPNAIQAAINILSHITDNNISEQAQVLLAEIYLDLFSHEEAKAKMMAILAKNAKNEKARLLLSKLHIKEGNYSEAFKELEEIFSLNSRPIDALHLLSQIVSFTEEDGKYIQQTRKLLSEEELASEDAGKLNLVLAKAYQDQYNYDKAFEHYQLANQHLNQGMNYDINKDKLLFKVITNTFNNKIFQNHKPNLSEKNNSPILVINFPGLEKKSIIRDLLPNKLLVWDNNPFLSQLLPGSRYKDDFHSVLKRLTNLLPEQLSELREAYLKNTGNALGECPFIDITPHNFLYVGLFKLLFPEGTVYYIKATLEETLLNAYTDSSKELGLDFTYDLANLKSYYDEFTKLIEHWFSIFPDIEIKEITLSSPSDFLRIFSSKLD